MARVFGYGVANTNGARSFAGKEEADVSGHYRSRNLRDRRWIFGVLAALIGAVG